MLHFGRVWFTKFKFITLFNFVTYYLDLQIEYTCLLLSKLGLNQTNVSWILESLLQLDLPNLFSWWQWNSTIISSVFSQENLMEVKPSFR